MTGFGNVEVTYNEKKIHIEVKSLNSKQSDVSTRLAPLYREKEIEIRQLLTEKLNRGKIDLSIWCEQEDGSTLVALNKEIIASYINQIKTISREVELTLPDENNLWKIILRLPNITAPVQQEGLTSEEWNVVKEGINLAIAKLTDFRIQEGEALQRKFEEKLNNIANLMAQIEKYEDTRIEKIRKRLTERLEELKGVDYDKNRLEQELIYYIEKLDISEEKQRLSNHLVYFRDTMNGDTGQGKKLSFIAQEMGREINTTGSKSNQAEMQNLVVMMKDELEQIKEQVLNVL